MSFEAVTRESTASTKTNSDVITRVATEALSTASATVNCVTTDRSHTVVTKQSNTATLTPTPLRVYY